MGRERFIWLMYGMGSQSVIEGSQDRNSTRNPEAGTEAEMVKEGNLLACLLFMAF